MMIVMMKISRTNFFAFILVVHQNFVQKHPHRRIKSLKSERERERETSRASSFKRARKLARKK